MPRTRIVFGSISLDLAAVILGGVTMLLPAFAKDVLEVGPHGFGMLRAAPGVGAAIVALWLAAHPIQRHAGRAMFAGVAVYGAATCAFALSRNLWLSVAALAVLGGADMLSVYVRQTLVQLVTPDPMRGRVAAVQTIGDNFGEVVEAEALETSRAVSGPIGTIGLPAGMMIGALVRGGEVIIPTSQTVIEPHDRVIVMATADLVRKVEKLFAVGLEFF